MKKMFFLCALFASVVSSGQVAVNLPSDRPIDPKAAFQVCGTARLDTMPLTTTPTHVLVLDVNNDSIIHSIPIASFVSILSSMIPPTQVPIVRVYTSNATWTKPPGLKYIVVEMVGGGGGGSGTGSSKGSSGSGGGGGGYTRKIIATTSLNNIEDVIVGIGGTGGAAIGNSGGDGTNTSFGTHCFSTGGKGGLNSSSGWQGGAAGIGVNGDINISGNGGGQGGSLGNTGIGIGGSLGGGSFFCGGAPGSAMDSDGLTGNQYGAGGGGGSYVSGSRKSGGNGSGGIVIITEYY